MYKRMLRSALAVSFIAVLGLAVLGSSGEISWSAEAAAGPGEISWSIEAASSPGEISWFAPASTGPGEISWSPGHDRVGA
ncbi:hypothetical protein ACIOEW_16005 [Streptomyces sp. NPDC087901]|uniref:hypothetical protein n=1 Tax=unclassified Streptomyces TaxID=2593676 RepID=UPI00332B522D